MQAAGKRGFQVGSGIVLVAQSVRIYTSALG